MLPPGPVRAWVVLAQPIHSTRTGHLAARASKGYKVNSEQRNPTLAAAEAAARRLLVRAIDVRFDLEDAAEAIDGDHGLTRNDVRMLRAHADALRHEIDSLAIALWPSARYEAVGAEEGSDEAEESIRA